MEHSIIISLDEYNSLIKIRDEVNTAFNAKKTIVFHDSYFPGHSGYPVHRFSVVSNDDFAKDLQNKIERIERDLYEQYQRYSTLEEKYNKKKGWF